MVCGFGALPYLLSQYNPGIANSFFESISGFTTTGSSVIQNVEILPQSILWWRSLTQWIGGLGVLVVVAAILPFLKVGGLHLFSTDSNVLSSEKLMPRIKETAKRLWFIYIMLTISECILLICGEMNIFESLTFAFGTVSSGGFSIKNGSLAGYSQYSQYIVSAFMLVSGLNFVLLYHILKGNFKKVIKDEELRVFAGVIIIAIILLSINLIVQNSKTMYDAVRLSVFHVISIISSTGFSTENYMGWPILGWALLFVLMFFGACSGSTGGGIRIIRHVLSFKILKNNLMRLTHPKAIITLSLNHKKLDDSAVLPVLSFIILYFFTFVVASLIITSTNIDIETSMGAVISSMGGIGPGIGMVGPTNTYAHLPLIAKVVLSICMIMGRLEILPIYLLMSIGFWKN